MPDLSEENDTQRDQRQERVFSWAKAAFTTEQATSLPQQGLRLLEEAIEAFQAAGGGPRMAHELIDYVFARPVGDLHQELGGVGVCLLAFAAAAGVSADAAERHEVARVCAEPLKFFQRRNATKNALGFLAVGGAKGRLDADDEISLVRDRLLAKADIEALSVHEQNLLRDCDIALGDVCERCEPKTRALARARILSSR